MEIVLDLIKIVLPAALSIYAMVLIARNIFDQQLRKQQLDQHRKNVEIVLPLRLQAYERMTLFLERISPENIIPRVNQREMEAGVLHQMLLKEIREEFNHNLSQQVYVGPAGWEKVKTAMQEIIAVINTAARDVELNARSIELGRRIIDIWTHKDNNPVEEALIQLKSEIQAEF